MPFKLTKLDVQAADLVFTSAEPEVSASQYVEQRYEQQNPAAFLNNLMLTALKLGASDIHFEPYEQHFRVRARVDGVMQEQANVPRAFGHQLIIRLKVIAGLDISEHKENQTGRFRMLAGEHVGVDFRASITPTLYGETLVLRMLHLPAEQLAFDVLGLSHRQVDVIEPFMQRQQGMILVTGPTGSGKTVTLYTLLKQLNRGQRNIYTVEDPVEINLPGVNQININERQDITYGAVARTILRQDPDVIMLGEMRDADTVDTAIKAAHTGHLVLSTLHATSAAKAIPRLRNLGADRHNLAAALSLIVSQRLLRCLEPGQRETVEYPRERLLAAGFRDDEITGQTFYRANTPEAYRGRIGVFEVVPVTAALARLIEEGAGEWQLLQEIQRMGVTGLRRQALELVKQGVTDLAEIERVFGPVSTDMAFIMPAEATNAAVSKTIAEVEA